MSKQGQIADRALTPQSVIVEAVEITHADMPQAARVVNDTQNREIEGNEYIALRFDVTMPDAADGRRPRARLVLDNVGRELNQWIEVSNGGVGATARLMRVRIDSSGQAHVEWELGIGLAAVSGSSERVEAELGYGSLLSGPAVTLRYDVRSAPGLF